MTIAATNNPALAHSVSASYDLTSLLYNVFGSMMTAGMNINDMLLLCDAISGAKSIDEALEIIQEMHQQIDSDNSEEENEKDEEEKDEEEEKKDEKKDYGWEKYSPKNR